MAGPADTTDDELMVATASGDCDAFASIVVRHEKKLVNFFRRMGALDDEALDLTQETFLRAYAYRARYRPEGRFQSFLYSLARNAWCDMGRKAQRRPRTISSAVDAPAREGANIDSVLDSQSALDALPEKLRATVVLAVCQDLDYATVGEILGIPLGTVKSRIFLAVRRMRETLRVEA